MQRKEIIFTSLCKFHAHKSVEGNTVYPKVLIVSTGTPKTINFPFGTNGKLMVLGVQILSKLWHIDTGYGNLISNF